MIDEIQKRLLKEVADLDSLAQYHRPYQYRHQDR